MELREPSRTEEAARYARIIASWHASQGIAEWQRRFGDDGREQLARYRKAVRRFEESDFSDPAMQLAIAEEQISGSMEWAYATPLPPESDDPGAKNLGELARKLRDVVTLSRRDAEAREGRTPVRFSDRQELLAKAREVYATDVGADAQGAGGLSFLLSCSLERPAGSADGELDLLSPEILGVTAAPRGRAGDLLDQLDGEGLEILDVTGSTS